MSQHYVWRKGAAPPRFMMSYLRAPHPPLLRKADETHSLIRKGDCRTPDPA